jgi:hypothetical protein
MAGAGGAMRATGWRATAIRFQQFGEGFVNRSFRHASISIWLDRGRRALTGGVSNNRKTRRLLTNRPCLGFVYEESHSKRTSTRQQLDCAETL